MRDALKDISFTELTSDCALALSHSAGALTLGCKAQPRCSGEPFRLGSRHRGGKITYPHVRRYISLRNLGAHPKN
jgi:hypothetical protein